MQSINRIEKILDCFSPNAIELSLDDLTRKSDLPKPTVYRLAEALCKVNFLNRNKKNNRYRIGIKLFELGSLYIQTLELRQIAFSEMERLNKKTGEAVHMGILDGEEVVSIEGLESVHSLQTKLWVGKRSPIYCTAVGKVILANLSKEKRQEIYNKIELKQFTENTITDIADLEKEVEKIQKEVISIDNEEHDNGIICVGAPIFNYNNEIIASISISGPKTRMDDHRISDYKKYLLEAVSNILNRQKLKNQN